jgi:hypothetical protein
MLRLLGRVTYIDIKSRQDVRMMVGSRLDLDAVSRHDVKEAEMPKQSRKTAPQIEESPILVGRYGELDEYTVGFETYLADADGTPFFRGLPDDRCQSPHWGYVFAGSVTFRYDDHEETFEAGDAYYAPPGHVPSVTAGTELVEFAPTAKFAETMAAVARNLAAAGAAS